MYIVLDLVYLDHVYWLDLPNPGIEPRSPALQTDALPSEPLGKPYLYNTYINNSKHSYWMYHEQGIVLSQAIQVLIHLL